MAINKKLHFNIAKPSVKHDRFMLIFAPDNRNN